MTITRKVLYGKNLPVTSGAIHWHITYEPREENGFIEVAP